MFLKPYFSEASASVSISPEQASQFAKRECLDFNPIHDPDAKRFCVPGDLLFALVLAKYGVSTNMTFKFVGMVGGNTQLQFPDVPLAQAQFQVNDSQSKPLLEVERHGAVSREPEFIEALVKSYVVFSGKNFPELLMPLMEAQQVMFNPARPLVMYESMSFELDSLAIRELSVELTDAQLQVEGKRADEFLHFAIRDGERIVGRGVKKAVLGGLKPFDADAIGAFADAYEARRTAMHSDPI